MKESQKEKYDRLDRTVKEKKEYGSTELANSPLIYLPSKFITGVVHWMEY